MNEVKPHQNQSTAIQNSEECENIKILCRENFQLLTSLLQNVELTFQYIVHQESMDKTGIPRQTNLCFNHQ